MKSSSRLFPAQLISAEMVGDLSEDVYLIKPNNSTDKTVQIAVTHLSRPVDDGSEGEELAPSRTSWWRPSLKKPKETSSPVVKPALILLHGCYQNRRLWFSQGKTNLVELLLDSGFDLWLMEHRGHGMSPLNQHYETNTLVDYARYDIPAVNAFVAEKSGTKPSWVGYGEGAGALLMALAAGNLLEESISDVTGIGSPFLFGHAAKLPLAHWLAAPFSRHQCVDARRGPELEPWSLRRQLLKEGVWPSLRGANMGIDLWSILQVKMPPIYWLGSKSLLPEFDEGLAQLYDQGKLKLLDDVLGVEMLSPEHIQETLADEQKVEPLLQALQDAMDRLLSDNELLPTRKTIASL